MNRLLGSLVPLLVFVGCGGGAASGPSGAGGGSGTGPTGGGPGNPTQAGDVQLDLDAQKIQGFLFEPEALGRPGMPVVPPPKGPKLTLAQQKQKFQVQKNPLLKQVEAAIYASALYTESKNNAANASSLIAEGRDALREAATAAGKQVDDTTLRLLAVYETTTEDWPAAEKAWEAWSAAAKKANPKDADLPEYLAWQVHAMLKQNKDQAALALVKSVTPDSNQPLLAYTIAWTKWRTNDQAGAWQALTTAAKGVWQGGRQEVDRDLLLFAGRSAAIPLAQAKADLYSAYKATTPDGQYATLARLGAQGYGYAGRWQEAIDAVDQALALNAPGMPANDRFVLPYSQADFAIRLDNPERSAKYAKIALDAVQACDAKCGAKEKTEIVNRIAIIARLFHVLYATTNDIRYYQPANDIYIAVIPQIADQGRRTEINKDAGTLQQTFKTAKAGSGNHDRAAINALLSQHNQEIQACYELGLLADPKLGGTVTVTVESDNTGENKGVNLDPKPGVAGLSAVTTCIEPLARKWKLPKRGMAGSTRVKISYNLTPPAPKRATAATP
ncbi:MAG: AgmX/PglI C-terminal domain-containing protein [Deltaproteobacteria bacterium]|nr:AgmX/PglI C-terminal domain-containing protein [Deltaproteobacteria bacterium]MCW5808748.1 AgmX/PglI C-terminal domain-containing protein [Deltaproteobacteria bacterium]